MKRHAFLFVFALMCLTLVALLGLSAARAQIKPGPNVNLSQMAGNQTECAIAKNPSNKLQLFALCNNNAGAGLFAARSIDGGQTRTYPDPSKTIANGVNPALGPAACCDPELAWDTFGNLFIVYIDSAITTIDVLLSTDGGQTFTNITPASFGPFCAGCVDQPHLVAANTSAMGAPVAVWITWHQNPSAGPIVASGAAVTGLGTANIGAFSAPQNVPGTGDCSYGDVAIASSGAVVQTCQTPSTGNAPGAQILVNTKPDGLGPNPFGAPVVATTTNVAAFHPVPPQSLRTVDAEAKLAYDANPTSPHFGRLHLSYTDEPVFGSGATNIMLRFSDNDGANWSNPPIFVNDDSATNTTTKFLPRIASDRLSGNIAVCWYDDRNSATNTAMEVFCTIATPTGASPAFMANGQIGAGLSTAANNGRNQFGDYSGLAYFQGLAHPAWPDTSNSTGDNPDGTTAFDIYSDRVSGGPALTVKKVLVPGNDPGRFDLLVDGTVQLAGAMNNGTVGPILLDPGTHTVSENPSAGTVGSEYSTQFQSACAPSGTVSLAAGDNKTCTVVNFHGSGAFLTVNKILRPADDPGRFDIFVDGALLLPSAGNGDTTGAIPLPPGTHFLDEQPDSSTDGSMYRTSFGGGCRRNGTITLAAGDNKTCIISNRPCQSRTCPPGFHWCGCDEGCQRQCF